MFNLIKRFLKWVWEKIIIGEEDWLETTPREDKAPPIQGDAAQTDLQKQVEPPSREDKILPPPPAGFIEQTLEIGADVPPQYRKQKSVLTFRERIFFKVLLQAAENQYQVFVKVRLADVVWLANEPKDRKDHIYQILCKHLDFVVCRNGQEPELAIELDDSSHKKYDHQLSDQTKEKILQMAGLPLVRIKVQEKYDVQELREMMQKTIPSVFE